MVSTEGKKLQALWPSLEGARRRRRYANGVLRTDVEELVVELDPAAPAQNDIDLLRFGMAMCERAALAWEQAKVSDTVRSDRSDARATRASQRSPKPFAGAASSTSAKLTIVNASGNETPSRGPPHHRSGSATSRGRRRRGRLAGRPRQTGQVGENAVTYITVRKRCTMPEHRIGTREEWGTARDELAKLEAEHAELGQKVTEQRRQLPWVPVEKEYRFDTEDGEKTLAELFDGRSQLLAYNIMFGPEYELGACPGCSNVADELDATRVHLSHRDVTLICFSRAPIGRLIDYKRADGLAVPVRLDQRDGVSVRLRARSHARAGAGDPRGQGNDRSARPSGCGTGGSRSEPGSRTAYARALASSRSPATTGASTTPTR